MSVPEKLLLHTCCAPCLIAPYRQLKAEGIGITAFWFNPNIHPFTEYRSRLETLQEFARQEDLPLILKDDYGLRKFLAGVGDDIDNRCRFCYTVRLEETAKTAYEHGFDAFGSTLLYSKYQKHDLIREIGEAVGSIYGIPFFYRDWRPLWDEGVRLSKEAQMYRQKYCGCIFSEEERYLKKLR
ncbi:MAG TPA: epoxyqueuosine reductase QueH [Candidatus Syntrophosphaera sp.]|jgi:predicted adenine nucleotide alpha hydrolase (AANH) superfamily ATPase|nr:epoxyqueuosine reductase QueH [Candidatus Syntrophosphaera sp.]